MFDCMAPRRSSRTLPPGDPRHGTINGYGNLYCRCDRCKEANRLNHNEYIQKARASGHLANGDVTHGSSYRYDVGCRCDLCREAHNEKSRQTKQRIRERNRRGAVR